MPPWTDYIIPVAIVTLLAGSAAAWLVLTVLEHAGEVGARLGAWWSGQAEAAERRRAERATRKAVPLVSINWGNGSVKSDDEAEDDEPFASPVAPTATPPPQPIAMTTTDRNTLLLYAKADALAAMIKAGKVGETEGIKIVYGLSPSGSNPRYAEARSALKAALGALERRYPTTPDQEQAIREKRGELGLI